MDEALDIALVRRLATEQDPWHYYNFCRLDATVLAVIDGRRTFMKLAWREGKPYLVTPSGTTAVPLGVHPSAYIEAVVEGWPEKNHYYSFKRTAAVPAELK